MNEILKFVNIVILFVSILLVAKAGATKFILIFVSYTKFHNNFY